MRDLRGVVRCGCHGWPWHECDELVPKIEYGIYWGLFVWFRAWPMRGNNLKGITE